MHPESSSAEIFSPFPQLGMNSLRGRVSGLIGSLTSGSSSGLLSGGLWSSHWGARVSSPGVEEGQNSTASQLLKAVSFPRVVEFVGFSPDGHSGFLAGVFDWYSAASFPHLKQVDGLGARVA